jgi:hypothetical protein
LIERSIERRGCVDFSFSIERKKPVRNFLNQASPGVLAITTAAVLSTINLTPSTAPGANAAAPETPCHLAGCSVCQLPLYGRSEEPSILGSKFATLRDLTADETEPDLAAAVRRLRRPVPNNGKPGDRPKRGKTHAGQRKERGNAEPDLEAIVSAIHYTDH